MTAPNAEPKSAKAAHHAAWYAAHRDDQRAKNAAWYAAHREECRARHSAYRVSHRVEIATWQIATRERKSAWHVAYWAAHPEQRREYLRKSGARRRGARTCEHPACLVTGATQLAWQTNDHVCWMCGTPVWQGVNLHMDHVLPVSRGGLHCADNLRPACGPCNLSKYNKVAT